MNWFGHSKTLILFPDYHFLAIFAVYFGSLSCWKVHCVPRPGFSLLLHGCLAHWKTPPNHYASTTMKFLGLNDYLFSKQNPLNRPHNWWPAFLCLSWGSGVPLGHCPWRPVLCSVRWSVCLKMLAPTCLRLFRMALLVIPRFFLASRTTSLASAWGHFWLLTSSRYFTEWNSSNNASHSGHWYLNTFGNTFVLPFLVGSHNAQPEVLT